MDGIAPDKVAVVILNWNGGEVTRLCLQSLLAQTVRLHSIIVVDNGSHDGSPDQIAAEFPDVVMIRNSENRGYGAGNNQGTLYALERGAEWVLWLNNDTHLREDCLETMCSGSPTEHRVGAITPKILYWDAPERIWCAGGHFSLVTSAMVFSGYGKRDGPAFSKPRLVDFVPTCAFLVSREALSSVGLFDEMFYPAYQEDADFCVRLRKAGYLVYYQPRAVVLHKVSYSVGGEWKPLLLRLGYKHMALVQRKHLPRYALPVGIGFQVAKAVYRALLIGLKGRFVLHTMLLGLWTGMRAPVAPVEPRVPSTGSRTG